MQEFPSSLSESEDPQLHVEDEHGQHDEQLRQTTFSSMINGHSSNPTTGPHDRILDPDIRNIWKDMGWKGRVKAKHFVSALRDYFFEKTQVRKHQGGEDEKILMSETQDRWALRYLDLIYLQSIREAIDDDASGFIIIEELNRFTSSRPLDWSLLKWLAYWAIGFNMAMVQQRTAIHKMLDEMFSLVPILRRENQVAAREYLYNVWENVITVTASLVPRWTYQADEFLERMFKDYTEGEEDRMRRNLISVKYKIDGVDTLYLVTGPSRIEKNFFTLVKVLLERHLQIFHIARTRVLNKRELGDAWDCFKHVKSAIDYRLLDLKVISLDHSLVLSTWLKSFADGMFDCSNDVSLFWSFNILINYKYDQSVYDASNIYDDSNYKEILVYEEGQPDFLDTRNYELLPTSKQEPRKEIESADEVKNEVTESAGVGMEKCMEVLPVDAKLGTPVEELAVDHPLIGEWRCLMYDNSSSFHPRRSMFTINFEATKIQPQDGTFTFTATGSLYTGEYWTLTGTCRQFEDGENKIPMTYLCKYFEEYDDEYFSGTFDTELGTISGTAGTDADTENHGDIVFISQQPAEVLVHRPHPTVLAENRIPSLWKFARGAIIHQVRKKMWSWSYFRDRRDNRKRFLELSIRLYWFGKTLTDEEREEYYAVKRTLYPADARYLVSLGLRTRMERVHVGRHCNNCHGELGLERVICMDCITLLSRFEPLELCGDRDCLTSMISRDDLHLPHLPSHRTFKARKMLLLRDIGFAWRTAENAIARGDRAITKALVSYEAENTPDTALEIQANENDDSASKVYNGSTKESGSQVEGSHKNARTDAEPTSPVTGGGKQVDAINLQTVESTSTPSAPLSVVLREPDSSGDAEDNTDKVDTQNTSPRGEDVVVEPSRTSSEVTSQQGDESRAGENEEIALTKSEDHSPDSPLAVAIASDPDSAGHKKELISDGKPRAKGDAKSETSEHTSWPWGTPGRSLSRNTAVPSSATRCYYCDQNLESPCWCCADCEDTILICMFCEPADGFDKDHHKKVHTLLSVRRSYEETVFEEQGNRFIELESKVEGKLSELEARLNTLDDRIGASDDRFSKRLDAIDQRMDQTLRSMDERFTRVESLLERVIIGQSGANK